MRISTGRGMQLLHWYADAADNSPGSVLDSDLASSSGETLTAARARVLLIGTIASRCPEVVRIVTKLHRVDVAEVGKLKIGRALPKSLRLRPVHVPIIERRSVLVHWCALWREECALKAEIGDTRVLARLNECTTRLTSVQRRRERCEDGRLMYRGLIWFCGELELRIAEADEEREWSRWLVS
jgi:hypothetical protein